MAKRIWFKPKYHTALRLGLGYKVSKLDIMKAEAYCPECCGVQLVFDETNNEFSCPKCDFTADIECEECLADVEWHRIVPKTFTTRTHRLSDEYVVVKGDRFHAQPVESRIEFQVFTHYKLNLRTGEIESVEGVPESLINLPETDLGYKGATFEDLRRELLLLNKKATEDTVFYINRLEPIVARQVA